MTPKVLAISNYRSGHTARPEAELFVSLAKRGWDITIMTYSDASYIPRFEEAGCKIIGWHPTKKYGRSDIKQIRAAIVDNKIDIVHAFNSVSSVNAISAGED